MRTFCGEKDIDGMCFFLFFLLRSSVDYIKYFCRLESGEEVDRVKVCYCLESKFDSKMRRILYAGNWMKIIWLYLYM